MTTGTRSCRTPAGSSARWRRPGFRGSTSAWVPASCSACWERRGTPREEAVGRVEPGKALQGSLDPAILLAPWEVIEERALDVIEKGRTAEGHIFNLGHGVLPETNPDTL